MTEQEQRINFLLGNGYYFPKELPPPFVTQPFADHATGIRTVWDGLSPSCYSPEIYSAPRGGKHTRRELAIVHPVPQLSLAGVIVDEWSNISRHIEQSEISSDMPALGPVSFAPFDKLKRRKLEIASAHNHMLASDFSRFYGTLYTHAISWALHTKKWCKENINQSRKALGGRLDTAITLCQQRETFGIPIGPYTSRIISEIVAVAVDIKLQESSGFTQNNAVRHWDDWFIGIDGDRREQETITDIVRACREFRIEINTGKTKLIPASSCIDPIWVLELRRFELEQGKQQKLSIERFFSLAFDFMRKFPGDNVLLWAAKKAAGKDFLPKVDHEHWGVFENYLMLMVRTDMAVLNIVGQIFAKRGNLVNFNNIQKLILDIIREKSSLGHHFEVAWALFLAMSLRIKIPGALTEEICQRRSAVCILLLLDLKHQSLIDGPIDEDAIRHHLTSDGLRSDMWLLAYEAVKKGWITGVKSEYVKNDEHFGPLLERNVFFYREDQDGAVIDEWREKDPSEDILY